MTESILIRVKDCYIGTNATNYYTWTGIRIIKYEPTEQWVNIKRPYGKMLHQEIGSPHINGEIHCYDFNALKTAIYNTVIDNYNHTAIDATNSTTVGSVEWTVGYFIIHFTDQSGNLVTATLSGFAVRIVELVGAEAGKEAEWIIRFHCDEIVYS